MEILDIYDENANKTGKTIERSNIDKLKDNEHIAVAIIYIENSNNEFLIQKTSKEKGGLYSSTGGHILHNEEPIDTIKREVKEELGISIDNENIISLGHILIDFPIRYIFYLKKDIDLSYIKLQKEEVDSISYMSIYDIKDKLSKGLMHQGHYKVLEEVIKYISNN